MRRRKREVSMRLGRDLEDFELEQLELAIESELEDDEQPEPSSDEGRRWGARVLSVLRVALRVLLELLHILRSRPPQ